MAHNSQAKNLFVFGGNRSGKTEFGVVDTLKEWDGTHPFRWLKPRPDGNPCLIWVISETRDVQRDTLQKKFERFMPESWIIKKVQKNDIWDIIKLKVPNERYGYLYLDVVWRTYDQHRDTFESASLDGTLCDEEPPKWLYDALQTRLLDAKSWGNGWFKSQLTPTKGKGWSIEKFWHPQETGKPFPDVFCVQMSTYDNAHNIGGAGAVRALELSFPEHERQARIYGNPSAKFGYVLDKYVDQYFPNGHLLKPFYPNWDFMTPWESIDHGYAMPASIGFYAIHMNGEVYRYDEIYLPNRTIPQLKREIYIKRKKYGYSQPYMSMIDPSTGRKDRPVTHFEEYLSDARNVWVGKGAEPTEIYVANLRQSLNLGRIDNHTFDREMKLIVNRAGYISMPINVVKSRNARDEGWELFNNYLTFDQITKRPRFYVVDHCSDFRREARSCKFKENQEGKVGKGVSGDDHALDEGRYLLMGKPFYYHNFDGIIDKSKLVVVGEQNVRIY